MEPAPSISCEACGVCIIAIVLLGMSQRSRETAGGEAITANDPYFGFISCVRYSGKAKMDSDEEAGLLF